MALADIELAKIVLEAVERKQARSRKEQKEFELIIAEKGGDCKATGEEKVMPCGFGRR
ncbi:MAG: hypothetical protein U0231_13965 [Nitrospiraceae bacterium]